MRQEHTLIAYLGIGLIVLGFAWIAYEVYMRIMTSKESMKVTPSPIETEPPASNAPVKGEPKQVIIPEKWEDYSTENTSNYTLSNKMVVRWDLIPPTATMVTFGMRMSNPPITGTDNHNEEMVPLISSDPASDGISIGFKKRGRYVVNGGHKFRSMEFVRDTSDFDPSEERLEIKFTEVAPNRCKVVAVYNGEDKVIAQDKQASIKDIRMWPQQLLIDMPNKIQNVWVTYA